MKQGWTYKKLGELGTIVTGSTPSTKIKEYYCSNDYCFIKPSDLPAEGYQIIVESENYISSKGYEVSRKLPKGSVLVSCIGIIGKTAILGMDACTNQQINAIIPNEYVNNKFLAYSILSQRYVLSSVANAPVVPLINKSDFSKVEIPLPPLSVQHSIVSELDKINELIRLKKEQLKDYDNLAQSIFFEMFGDPVVNEKGWEVKKLGEVAMIKTGPFGSMLHKEDYITGGIPLINPMHIQNFKAVPDKDFSISKEKATELCNYQLKINDVIFARRGVIGRCAVISDKEAGCLCGTGSLFVRFERKLSSIYTMYVVRTTSFIKELVSKAKGATMLNLNSSTMENLRFPIPPLPLQQLFAQRIELIEKQKAEIQSTIADLETLLASRMQYWFD